jgi:hypothetical protein
MTPMKLPRWLVVSMLAASSLAILALAGWWWVTWPERTMHEFRSLINDGQFDQANAMVTNKQGSATDEVTISGRFWRRHPNEDLFFLETRTLDDLLNARRVCKLPTSRMVVVFERSRISARTESGATCKLHVLGD